MSWTLQTVDTLLTVEAGEHCPIITHLSTPGGTNWAEKPTALLFTNRLAIDVTKVDPNWTLCNTEYKEENGQTLVITYKAADYEVYTESIWTTRPGPGPVEHGMMIRNKTGKPITIHHPNTLDAEFKSGDETVELFYVSKDRLAPRIIPSYQCNYGTFTEEIVADYEKDVWTTLDGSDTGYSPCVMLHANKSHGVYIGWEWNEGRIHVSGRQKNDGLYVGVVSGPPAEFCTELVADQDFEAPATFIGCFTGSIDDGSNRLRKWLFNYMMPEINRTNENIPYVNWNAFHNTAVTRNSWYCEEKNYYSMIDAVADVGMEEVTIDIGWWEEWGDFRSHSERWARGMKAACDYAHEHNMLFTLYFALLEGDSDHPMAITKKGKGNAHPEWFASLYSIDMSIPECKKFAQETILHWMNEYNLDGMRTDLTPIPYHKATAATHQGCHDAPYWNEKGHVEFLDYLLENRPGVRYQNCNCGSAYKGCNLMKRSTCVQITDIYTAMDMRRAIWDSVYCHPLMQLMTQFGDVCSDVKLGNPSYRFRSYLMGAPSAHIETPAEMSAEERDALRKCIASFKSRVRPLIRYGDVYHVLPRPDGFVWDGLELYDPERGTGMVSVFRPDNEESEIRIPLKGIDANSNYLVEYDDETLPAATVSGAELINEGLRVCLPEKFSAEWVFITKQN